ALIPPRRSGLSRCRSECDASLFSLSAYKGQSRPKGDASMRRTLLMVLAVLSAAAMPLAASAGPGSAKVAQPSAFTLGGQKCSLIAVRAADGKLPVGVGTCPGVRPGAVVQT